MSDNIVSNIIDSSIKYLNSRPLISVFALCSKIYNYNRPIKHLQAFSQFEYFNIQSDAQLTENEIQHALSIQNSLIYYLNPPRGSWLQPMDKINLQVLISAV